ncbi:MAG TPA: nicotinate phosphoribosyltransferase [Anaerolineae bacterium]|nr:nicotinate phosphoribosyltransferase [Anaerolineae bacterium]
MQPVPMSVKTDSYKAGHFAMYPEANKMVAYGEFRQPFKGLSDDRIVFYGLRYIVENHIMRQWTMDDVTKAEWFYAQHNAGLTPYPFPKALFTKFIQENDGYFPIKIEAMPEGSVVYPHIPVYQLTAKGEYSRLLTFFETLLTQVWYPTNVATLSRLTKHIIHKAFAQSVDPDMYWLLASRLHDFGYRGATSDEQAMLGGVAHLLNFDGTDTMNAAWYAHQLNDGEPFAQSIPATEHSVMTSWRTELDAVENMITQFGDGLFATVADSYDYNAYLETVLPAVAAKVKEKGGTMVVRPDSGDPVTMVVKALDACARHFGYTTNDKGYKVLLNSAVIQGDGIDYFIIQDILDATLEAGFSAQNVAFGMGGGLLQKHNRDTMSFATKLSFIEYADGRKRDVMKMPTGDSSKFSLPGELHVIAEGNGLSVVPAATNTAPNLLETIYDCGPVGYQWDKFSLIRQRIEHQWAQRPANWDVISPALQAKVDAQIAAQREMLTPA